MTTWRAAEPPAPPRTGPGGRALAALRGVALAVVCYGGLLLLLLLRLFERPLCGAARRPVTQYVPVLVSRGALAVLGLRRRVRGRPMTGKGALVANHASWLDIFALNASTPLHFVAKSEVAGWPGIGWLARATGTVFIRRDRREARAQQAVFEARLRAGQRLLFFPEGTSTDGLRVLPFKSTLFAAFYTHGLDHVLSIQPVSVIWRAPEGADPRLYAWWGDMDFAPHLLSVLARARQGEVELVFHDPVPVDAFPDRKDLARYCETAVRRPFLPD